jgi:hypothetical protein
VPLDDDLYRRLIIDDAFGLGWRPESPFGAASCRSAVPLPRVGVGVEWMQSFGIISLHLLLHLGDTVLLLYVGTK